MQAYAAMFFTGALLSALFIDSGVKSSVARTGKISLAVFTALFAVAEILALLV